jgi:hypothetical protein
MVDSPYREMVTQARQLLLRMQEDEFHVARLIHGQIDVGIPVAQVAKDLRISPRRTNALYQIWNTYISHKERSNERR